MKRENKRKKIILIIALSVITIILAILLVLKIVNKKPEEIIIQSNERDETKEQLKITTESINIRKEASTESEILGTVKEDEIYTILDNISDEYHEWYLIETNTNIKGYISGRFEEDEYVEILNVEEKSEEE